MSIWFTSDTHWNHANVLGYSKRPFASVEEMNEALIARWNACVRKGDVVYHLGDFAWATKPHHVEQILRRLTGSKHLILGNHDHKATRQAAGFASMDRYREITVGEQHIVLFHYALRVWNRVHYGSWQLFGHSHGSLRSLPHLPQMDVGVDCWSYAPVSFDEIREYMKGVTFMPVDHHGRLSARDETLDTEEMETGGRGSAHDS